MVLAVLLVVGGVSRILVLFRGGGVFICVKNYIDCRELWTHEDFEITAVEAKGSNPKFTWEVVGIGNSGP